MPIPEFPENTDAISLGVPRDENNEISLPVPGEMEQPLSRDASSARAAKTEFSRVIPEKTQKDYFQLYIEGKETQLRKEAATRADFDGVMERNKALQDLSAKKQGNLSVNEVQRVLDEFRPADPRSVIERAYADKYVSSLNTARGFMRDSMLDNARLEIGDDGVQKPLEYASDLLAKNQYIYNRVQAAEERVQAQSWAGWGADFGKGLFQPYTEMKQRGLIGSALSNWGLGGVLDTQHSKLYDMPMDGSFQTTFDKAMDALEKDNPQLAVSWGKSMLGQAEWESRLNNVFTGMMPFDYAGIAKGGTKLVTRGFRERQVTKAARDMVEAASKDPTFQPKTVAEGAGDLGEAAVNTVGGQSPLEKAETGLLSTWWSDARKFTSNSGTYLSREATNRLNDFVDQGKGLFNKLGTMNRVERAEESVLSPEVNRVRMDQIKREYKGPQNTFADIEGPVREPVSGTYWYKAKIVNYDATQFPDVATAQGFAKQIGLADPVIKGAEATKLYLPESAVKNLESIQTTEQGIKFFIDKNIEVIPGTRPEPGMVPYNIKTGKFEKTLNTETSAVEQQGLGFHIEHWIPLRENDDLTRDTMIKTLDNKAIKDALSTNSASGGEALKNSVLGWVRNSDDTMSVNESAQRKAATYAQANIHLWAKGLTRDLEDIRNGRIRYDELTGEEIPAFKVWAKNYLGGKIKGRQMNEEFTRTLNHAREVEGFFENPGQLQDWYQRSFKRDPSYLETKAYFNFVKLVEGDRMMMELSEFRNRARLGAEQVQLTFRDPKTNEAIPSKYFDAVSLKTFPNSTNNYILVMGKNKGDEVLHEIGGINDKAVKAMTDKIQKGEAKAYMIYDEAHMPLNGFADVAKDKLIRYVYTEGQAESKSLDFNHVTRRGGGHFEWDYDFYLKQADVRPQYPTGLNNKISGLKNFYVGDTTVMPIKNRAMGNDVAKIFNEAHELIKQGKWDEVKPLAAKLGIKWDEFTSWYNPGRDADGLPTRARLNPHEPIQVVARNRKISEMGEGLADRYRVPNRDDPTKFSETLVDKTTSGPENNFKVQYNQERNSTFDMRTINDIGTQGNPIYAHQPSTMVDPLETMNRALSRMINSTFMDDYKLYHVEHWLREAEPYLNANKNQIRANPFGWYTKPEWQPGVDKYIIYNLLSNKMKGEQFVGTPNKFDTWIHSATSHLADSFYTKYGPEEGRTLGQKAVTVAPIWMLQHLDDPVSFMRSVTFNFKLGLGAIPQFLVQAQTHSLIWALEPRHGTVGTYHTLLHSWGSFTSNPKVLEHLDDLATKLNMFGSKTRKGEWLEARKELENSGFEHVAGEYANLNNQLKTRFILNDFEKGLKVGQYPFRLGEQSTRLTAWYTAFREFRDANPTTPITNLERSQILSKADLLTVNMSRASSSGLNHGVFSLSTQFLTYQIKLAELFWGKRLGETTTERNLARARMVTFFSALYGVPNAIGVTGAPFSDNLREHFMDDLGYVPGEKWLSTMLNEGLPAWQLAMMTGKLPNVGDRFGSQGFQNIKQALNGSIPWWQAVGGASVSTFSNIISSGLDPYYQYSMSWLRGDRTDQRFSIKAADLVEPLKEISSVSTAAKWWTAIQTGLWVSKNEQAVTDVNPWQATLYGLTGLGPQEQDDMFINNKMIQGEKDAKKKALKEFIKDWRRGIEAMNNNDPEQGHQYKMNAIARARATGYDPDELAKAMAISSRVEKAVNTSNYQRFMQGDYNKRDDRKEYFRRQLNMENK